MSITLIKKKKSNLKDCQKSNFTQECLFFVMPLPYSQVHIYCKAWHSSKLEIHKSKSRDKFECMVPKIPYNSNIKGCSFNSPFFSNGRRRFEKFRRKIKMTNTL